MAKKCGNGEGTIYPVKGRTRRTLYGKTRAEVSEKLTKAMADRDGWSTEPASSRSEST